MTEIEGKTITNSVVSVCFQITWYKFHEITVEQNSIIIYFNFFFILLEKTGLGWFNAGMKHSPHPLSMDNDESAKNANLLTLFVK